MRKIIVSLLAFSLVGLGVIQYRFLVIGLKVAKARFDQQVGEALRSVSEELYAENEMSVLLGSVVAADPGSFTVSLDTLEQASESFFRDYLKDRLLGKGLGFDFAFAITDESEKLVYLQSADFAGEDSISYYRMPLKGFIAKSCACRPRLHLKVHGLLPYLFLQMNYLAIPYIAFFLLIGACFVWLVRFQGQQRRLDDIKNDFINNLTHELKTPVFTMSLAANRLGELLQPGQERRYLEVIRQENESLKVHINKVLELASLEKSRDILEKQPLEVHEALGPAIEHFGRQVELAGGSFSYYPEAEKSRVYADPAHLGNALQNLLDNALKYSPVTKVITVRTFNEKDRLCLSVSDQGMGISPENQKRIFEKFYRAPYGNLHDVKGFGLGLSYVNQVMRLHKGQVKVESEKGRGSAFILILPLIKQP